MSRNKPKKHHYVQRAYLDGFINPSGDLHVFDRRQSKTWEAKPKDIGFEKNFYTLEPSDDIEDIYSIETDFFSLIDGDGLRGLRAFADNPLRATTRNREWAMIYMAAASLRTPKTRAMIQGMNHRLLSELIQQTFREDDLFEAFISRIPAEFRDAETFNAEELREHGLSDDAFEYGLEKNWVIGMALEAIIPVAMHALEKKHWRLLRASKDVPFVTSDSPLGIYSAVPVEGDVFGIDNTASVVVFPVDKSRALIGMGGYAYEQGAWPAGSRHVNSIVAYQSYRHVFSSRPTFGWLRATEPKLTEQDYLLLGDPPPDPVVESQPIKEYVESALRRWRERGPFASVLEE